VRPFPAKTGFEAEPRDRPLPFDEMLGSVIHVEGPLPIVFLLP